MTNAPEISQTASTIAFTLQQQQMNQHKELNALHHQQYVNNITAGSNSLQNDQLETVLSKSLLSDKAILHHLTQTKKIIIEPFHPTHLSTTSYDVTLGKYYFRETDAEPAEAIFNPYSESMVKKVWGNYKEAETVSEWTKRTGIKLENIRNDERVIWIKPGETILGHTEEFIGGRETITTMMKARSSLGRNFIEVCKCAGWGDIGYVNRWTMEITNNSRFYSIPLIVGRRIAQIVFFDSDGPLQNGQQSYEKSGKYQTSAQLVELKSNWKPTDMLPKMYLDRESQSAKEIMLKI